MIVVVVVQAPPGAGKTTTVPLALLLHRPKYLKPSNRIVVSRHTSAQFPQQRVTTAHVLMPKTARYAAFVTRLLMERTAKDVVLVAPAQVTFPMHTTMAALSLEHMQLLCAAGLRSS